MKINRTTLTKIQEFYLRNVFAYRVVPVRLDTEVRKSIGDGVYEDVYGRLQAAAIQRMLAVERIGNREDES
jgi:hypothetical protein